MCGGGWGVCVGGGGGGSMCCPARQKKGIMNVLVVMIFRYIKGTRRKYYRWISSCLESKYHRCGKGDWVVCASYKQTARHS